MFSKFIKKIPASAEVSSELPREISAEDAWENRLIAATGNDQELLALAIVAPSIEQKLACVRELTSEEGMKAAEREFRKRDRRVHSLAKQRHETLVKQRETRAAAAELMLTAAALAEAPIIAANRLSELNQAWRLLDHTLIEDDDRSRFAKLQADLAELMRERGERKRATGIWSVAANQVLAELSQARSSVATVQEIAGMLAGVGEKTRATLAAMPVNTSTPMPGDEAVAVLGAEILSSLQDMALVEARLAILGKLQECPFDDVLWKELPPLADQRIEKVLNTRFEELLNLQDMERKKLQKQSSVITGNKTKTHNHVLESAVVAAEAALAAGHLDDAEKQLAILHAADGRGGDELQARIGALQSEISRLKDWQQWGGGLVRDELVLEAEALASSTAAGTHSKKLPIKQLENSIVQLRARWKELDRLGGATSKPLWQRFDTALKTAYIPVAAHLDKLNEARQTNLAARKSLLDVLDALDCNDQESTDWKEIKRVLDHFQTEWGKLGPIEHTVPHKLQKALLERMKAGVSRLEEPLKKAQAIAQSERRQLIDRAKTLAQDAQGRDMSARLRELQSQWQIHARSHPLPRKIENALWADFKAAIDAIVSLREAALNARDAEFKANQATREALISRLKELNQDTPPADIRRIVADVESEWNKAKDAPRNQVSKLESRYREAREQAQGYITGSAQRSWQLACDTLLARLALCEEMESVGKSADIEARWDNLPLLPPIWEKALEARFKSGCRNSAMSNDALDQLLLQLESTLEIPSPAAFQSARQTLRLMAMKNAMEGRRQTLTRVDIEKMTAAAIGCTHLSPDQRLRLQSIIAAMRQRTA